MYTLFILLNKFDVFIARKHSENGSIIEDEEGTKRKENTMRLIDKLKAQDEQKKANKKTKSKKKKSLARNRNYEDPGSQPRVSVEAETIEVSGIEYYLFKQILVILNPYLFIN